jgi:ABC-type oligopeptide transport system ATPase subunit
LQKDIFKQLKVYLNLIFMFILFNKSIIKSLSSLIYASDVAKIVNKGIQAYKGVIIP